MAHPRLPRRLFRTTLALVAAAGFTATACAAPASDAVAKKPSEQSPSEHGTVYGAESHLGNGSIRTFAELDGSHPAALGFTFTRDSLTGLPTALTDGKHCYDVNGDGKTEAETECIHSHDFQLDLPKEYLAKAGGPFSWAMLTWDPQGHAPDHVYSIPHFDFHLFIQPKSEVDNIRTGTCGEGGFVNCEDYTKARTPVPAKYKPADYQDFGAVVAAMGGHLSDPMSHEFHGQPFTHTFMYGAYAGRISFYEPMISKSWLDGLATDQPSEVCTPTKQPTAWQVGGWYPTEYCVRYQPKSQEYRVELTKFQQRQAS